jgi:ABC-type glycerol-3-phosphate transport system substrate-binding protein
MEASMKKAVVVVLALLMTAAMIMAGGQGETTAEGPVTITLWTKEGEADNALQWVYDLAEEFNQINAKQQVEVVKARTSRRPAWPVPLRNCSGR